MSSVLHLVRILILFLIVKKSMGIKCRQKNSNNFNSHGLKTFQLENYFIKNMYVYGYGESNVSHRHLLRKTNVIMYAYN